MPGKIKLPAPLENIEWRDPHKLNSNDYNPNVVLTREMELLKLSIKVTGWIQPILISPKGLIIDGFHRTTIARLNGWMVPCCVLHLDEKERMLLTVRINRAKGSHVALRMSELIQELLKLGCSEKYLAEQIGATDHEIAILKKGDIFKSIACQNGSIRKPGFLSLMVSGDRNRKIGQRFESRSGGAVERRPVNPIGHSVDDEIAVTMSASAWIAPCSHLSTHADEVSEILPLRASTEFDDVGVRTLRVECRFGRLPLRDRNHIAENLQFRLCDRSPDYLPSFGHSRYQHSIYTLASAKCKALNECP